MLKELKNVNMFLILVLIFMCVSFSFAVPKVREATGFAEGTTGGGKNIQVIPSRGTTGGGNAAAHVVTSMSELSLLASGSAPAVIIVPGKMSGILSIGSNKTIIGANSNAGMKGFRSSGSNIIIQNLNFGPSGGDVAELSGAKNVFITKCEFHDCGDELLSMVSGCDKITISWCKFYFKQDGFHHAFAHLIGSGDSDKGIYRTTFHHNWYAPHVKERMPRVRFGQVHIFNNLYTSDQNGYCIGVGHEAKILVEGCYFLDQGDSAWMKWGNGKIAWTEDNIFKGTSKLPTWAPNTRTFDPPYKYRHLMYKTEDIPKIVMANAGNKHTDDPPTQLLNSGATPQKNNFVNLVNCNSPNSMLEFNLDKKSNIRISVHDIMGRTVATVLNRTVSAGFHSIQFNRSKLSNGVYYLKFQSNSIGEVLKLFNY
ncbi:MAG: T9SS type A sorting domain-containing protein [Chitinispirillia bacterium]|jgi:pectate lyase